MKFLITGGAGFLGSNLAKEVLKRKESLVVFDNLSRSGSRENLDWLKQNGDFAFYEADIRSFDSVSSTVSKEKPDVVFHLAGQVAMTTSVQNPRMDFEINTVGTHNLLETLRINKPEAIMVYSSTNKVYGDLLDYPLVEKQTRYEVSTLPYGFDEKVPLNFQTPYGCSKGAADQFVLDYSHLYGIRGTVFRHSSIFGGRQFGTFDQGWIAWFVAKALEKRKGVKSDFTISGNGKQVRDVLFVEDLIDCYFSAVDKIEQAKGEAFNIGGGMPNSLSLLELFTFLEESLQVTLNYEKLPFRYSDQKVFVADIRKAEKILGWAPRTSNVEGLKKMISWVNEYV